MALPCRPTNQKVQSNASEMPPLSDFRITTRRLIGPRVDRGVDGLHRHVGAVPPA